MRSPTLSGPGAETGYTISEAGDDLDELDLLHMHEPGPGSLSRSPTFRSSPPRARAYDPLPGLYETAKEEARQSADLTDNPASLIPTPDRLPRHAPPRHVKRVLFIGGTALLGLAYLIMFTATKGTRYGKPHTVSVFGSQGYFRNSIRTADFYIVSLDHNVQLNVILMVSDGFGPASETFARSFVQHLSTLPLAQQQAMVRWAFPEGSPHNSQADTMPSLPLDPLLVGSSRVGTHLPFMRLKSP